MKIFTSVMIIILLGLCHYVDELSPKQQENLPAQSSNKAYGPVEYEQNKIDILKTDTVYYTLQNTKEIDIDRTVN
jgi:uncharacterized protein YpmB